MRSQPHNAALLLGEEPRVIVTAARSFWRHGIEVDVGTMAAAGAAVRSRAIRSVVSLGEHRDEPERFLAAMLDQIEGARYDLIVPCNDAALAAVSRFYAELSSLAPVSSPPPGVVNRVLVKALTLEAARACGVPVPRTFPIERAGDLDRLRRHLTFPVIVKPRRKMEPVSFKVRRIDTWDELAAAFVAEPDLGERCLIQEYCPGEGVGIETLMHRGEPLFVFQHRRLKELPRTGGVSVLAISEPPDEQLSAQAVRLLQTIQWEGVAMVEFRRDPETGRTALMEVNGRYWGSLPLTMKAGLDVPWYQWQLRQGRRAEVPAVYRYGLRVRWTAGALTRLGDAVCEGRATTEGWWREAGGLLHDLRPSTADALWSARDPWPALAEVGGTAARLAWRGAAQLLKRVLPAEVFSLIKLSRTVGLRATLASARARARRALGWRRQVPATVASSARSVLFVCHGNIIRSPMAAALFRRMLAGSGREIVVASAGVHAHPFNGPDLRAAQVAGEFGVSLLHHRAQPLSRELVRTVDLIVVMDYRNEAEVLARYPDARRKVYLMAACATCEATATPEIADPYLGSVEDVRRCFTQLDGQVERFARHLGLLPVDQEVEGRVAMAGARATVAR